MDVKTCTKCRETKVLTEFYRAGKYYRGVCKVCHNAESARWAKSHPEKRAETTARWVVKNPEKRKASVAKWDANNKESKKQATYRWRENNPERHAENTAAWNAAHPGYAAEAQRKYRVENKSKVNTRTAEWKKDNAAHVNAETSARKARKLQATPAWANEFFIEEAYDLAQRRTKVTVFKWHVDHIVPLKSKLVCGLHVENNLQVIPAVKNLSKGNRHWPDMPQQLGVHYG